MLCTPELSKFRLFFEGEVSKCGDTTKFNSCLHFDMRISLYFLLLYCVSFLSWYSPDVAKQQVCLLNMSWRPMAANQTPMQLPMA